MNNSVTEILVSMPVWLLAIIVVGGWTLVSVVGAAVTRSWASSVITQADFSHNSNLVSRVATAYALVASFLVVSVWQDFQRADSVTTQEGAALVAAYQDARSFPAPQRQAVDTAIRSYVDAVVSDEWRTMGYGNPSPKAQTALSHVFAVYSRIKVPKEDAVPYAALLNQLNLVISFREQRIDASGDTLHPVFWVLLIGGGILVTVASYFTHLSDLRAHLILTGLVAAMTSVVLFLIISINDPFHGDVSVPRANITHIIKVFDEIDLQR